MPKSVLVATAKETSSSRARITGAVATMAELPQTAVPTPIKVASRPGTPASLPEHVRGGERDGHQGRDHDQRLPADRHDLVKRERGAQENDRGAQHGLERKSDAGCDALGKRDDVPHEKPEEDREDHLAQGAGGGRRERPVDDPRGEPHHDGERKAGEDVDGTQLGWRGRRLAVIRPSCLVSPPGSNRVDGGHAPVSD